jgi:PEP-CTERM motif
MPIKKTLAVTLAGVLACGAAQASDLSYFDTVFDTDWTTAGLGGLRGDGTGSITLSGVSGTVTRAYLYWHGPTDSSNPLANAGVTFAGASITGANIGFSDDNFWSFDNSQAYRADVTALVTGNGSYSLSNFVKPDLAEVNGASLVVFFSDGNTANNRDVVLFDGNDANFTNEFDALGWNTTLSGINYTAGTASVQLHVSDGQNFGGNDDGTLLINGTAVATGGIFNGDSTPFAAGGVSNGKLWDVESFAATAFLSPGLNSLNIQLGSVNDALSLVLAAIDLPAGAAPEQPGPIDPVPAIPEPQTYALMLAGLSAVAWATRRRRRNG